jgi:hypothetical protein
MVLVVSSDVGCPRVRTDRTVPTAFSSYLFLSVVAFEDRHIKAAIRPH